MIDISSLKTYLGNRCSFASLVTHTDPKLKKGGRGGVPVNPLNGNRVVKVTEQVIQLNRDYNSGVIAKAAKTEGVDISEEWTPEPMSGRKWLPGYENLIEQAVNGDTLYLRTYVGEGNNPVKVSYLVDGRPATEEEVAIIKEYSPAKSSSNKQAEAGIAEENQVIPRSYKLEGVKSLKAGEFQFSE